MTTIVAATSGVRLVSSAWRRVYEPAARGPGPVLSRGQTAAVAVALGVVVAGCGLVGLYLSISILAARHDVSLADLVPAGIGGLVAVVVLDLVLSWMGSPVGWLRHLVRALSVGTVGANAVAG